MSKRSTLLFILFFIITIFSIGFIQTVYDVSKKESIRFFDIFEDTFVTPVKREYKLEKIARRLSEKYNTLRDSINSNRYPSEEHAEEVLFLAEDLKRNVLTLNRHIKAKEKKYSLKLIDSLIAQSNELYERILGQSDKNNIKVSATNLNTTIDKVHAVYTRKSILQIPFLVIKAFFTSTVFSEKYIRAYEGAIEETSIAAQFLRKWMQYFQLSVLGDAGSKAVRGKNNWYFFKPGFDYLVRPYMLDKRSFIVDYNDTALSDNPIETIKTFKNQLSQYKIDLLIVIVPGKLSIYPDMLNSKYTPEMAGRFSHSIRVMKELHAAGVECVDLFTPFSEERLRDAEAGDSMYLRMDTHWRARGVRLAARTVAERIKQYSWFDTVTHYREYFLDTIEIERIGDIGNMIELPKCAKPFPIEKTTCYQVYDVKRDTVGSIITKHRFKDDYRNSEILVLGDSFSRVYQSDPPRSAGWISHLAYELKQPIASIVSEGGASTLVRQRLARKKKVLKGKKLVVWEFIERDLRYGAEGWKDIEL